MHINDMILCSVSRHVCGPRSNIHIHICTKLTEYTSSDAHPSSWRLSCIFWVSMFRLSHNPTSYAYLIRVLVRIPQLHNWVHGIAVCQFPFLSLFHLAWFVGSVVSRCRCLRFIFNPFIVPRQTKLCFSKRIAALETRWAASTRNDEQDERMAKKNRRVT